MLSLGFAIGVAPTAGRQASEWFDDDGQVLARAYSSEDLQWIDWPGLGVFAFSAGSYEVRVWPEPNLGRETITETFFRLIRPIILQALGVGQVLHASATVGPEGLIAFCGKSGSGKSTLAFAMQQLGFRQFADDTVVLKRDRDRVVSHALPFMPRLRPASRAHFAATRLSELSPSEGHPPEVPLYVIILLEQNADLPGPRVSLVPPTRAFAELLPLAHCFDLGQPAHIRRLVYDYLEIAARVPTFRLEYPPNLQDLPQLTQTVIGHVGQNRPQPHFAMTT